MVFQRQLFQLRTWQIDWRSLIIGVVAGALLVVLWRRASPHAARWRRQVASRIRQSLASLRAGVEVRYQTEAAAYAQKQFIGSQWADLTQVAVPPQLLILPRLFDPAAPPDWTAVHLHFLWPELGGRIAAPLPDTIDLTRLLRDGRRTLVSGAAGSGKTSLLALCAHRCAAAVPGGPDDFLAPFIPALLHLAEINLAPGEQYADPAAPLITALQKQTSPLANPGLSGLIRRKLADGRLLLLLDGFDDLAYRGRDTAVAWLRDLLAEYPDTRLIAAAPLTGFAFLMELDFAWASLLPWQTGQIRQFAAQWSKTLYLSQPPRQRTYWRPGQTALETQLRFWQHALNQADDAKNGRPFRLCDVMTAALTHFLPGGEQDGAIQAFWARLAYTLLAEGKLALISDEAAMLAMDTAVADKTLATQLKQSVAGTPLFATWPNGDISFRSGVWRDFLAASHMAKNNLRDEAAAQVGQPGWVGVLRFLVAQVGGAELADRSLKTKELSPTRDVLFQVADWLPIAPDSGDWRRQTMILLGQMARQATFSRVLRQRAIAALALSAEPGIRKFLVQLLQRSDPFLRQAGAAALPALAPDKVIDSLAGLLDDGDARVRQTAVYALAWIHHPGAEPPLLMALVQGDDGMRQVAVAGLAQQGAAGEEILREALEDDDLRVRRAAVYGLTLLDAEWVEPALADLIRNDPEWLVRAAATEALEQLRQRHKPAPWQPIPVGRQEWLLDYARQEGRNVPEGAAMLPFLVQLLTEAESPKDRLAAAVCLGQLLDDSAIPALETAVHDADGQVRQAAFATLVRIRRGVG